MSWTIRPERAGDEAAIAALTQRAFAGHPHSDGSEAEMIARLRRDEDLLLSLVAEDGGEIIGQVTYSRAHLSTGDDGWMLLGPISVAPTRQKEGIGRALTEAGEAAIRKMGAKGITVLGDPQLYSRFGFAQHTPLRLKGELADYLQVKSFGAAVPEATVSFAPAFG
ncbi:GNAT family N-acetyltransferase [Aurantiacibacter suaedae]|uniref:GNAT family N-acetyltransferase n=1 Tax=Aurantiacibacter suaedae TaxID=2545755 RepID=UPI0010F86339|nr:N-acetyltransferase [Aurantiacibacter suaedae]